MSASQDANENQTGAPSKRSGERLNFIIAVCAILISAASFYATYLQADAANKQVKAMTMPLIQYGHGNVLNDDEPVVNFSLKNAGVGPALIKSMSFQYEGQAFDNLFAVLNHCCRTEVEAFLAASRAPDQDIPQFITSPVLNTIIPGQDTLMFMRLKWHEQNQPLWDKINDLRFQVQFTACYCSLLDECYQTDEQAAIKPVAQCR
ncbi:hypothetical protein [Marinicella meishanensis]|uniref:hypothetical protein n=1 Tax=Marinicella meishanensis TaxID=2873263 RepID=UPI001CC039CA|nr:hypothetical protein [Marinicella sp. NBU2979]